jgi:glycosyltransferase involved in cell wall biosynthesis
MLTVAIVCFVSAFIPGVLLLLNLTRYCRAPQAIPYPPIDRISVLIPARNEEENIADCVKSVLGSTGLDLEVLVLDDQSTDRTAEIVQAIAQDEPRLRLIHSLPLPPAWCGKQFACHQLAREASSPYLFFIDADVRLEPGAAIRSLNFLRASGADLVSGVPRQLAETFSEKLLIPLIHFMLLGFLPLGMMRRFRSPAFAAGCGQLFLARAEAYNYCGGHRSIAASGHDGIELPRSFRKYGFRTDLFDATCIATCRMYRSGPAVWSGLAKNAIEGIAKPTLIIPFTMLLFFGQILPPFLLAYSLISGAPAVVLVLCVVGTGLSYAARLISSARFEQSWLGVALHPVAILSFLSIQWFAFFQARRGRPFIWKGRAQLHVAL